MELEDTFSALSVVNLVRLDLFYTIQAYYVQNDDAFAIELLL